MTGGQVQFYAATEGREAAALVALSLSGADRRPVPRAGGAAAPASRNWSRSRSRRWRWSARC